MALARSILSLVCLLAVSVTRAEPSDPQLLKRARAELDAALADKDSEFRGEAYSALGLAHTADAREKLEAGVTDLDGKVRFGAARGLTLLADPKSSSAVTEAFKAERGWAIRKELAQAAAAIEARALIPELEKATHAPQRELAQAAAWALSDLKAPQGKLALERLGSPPRKNVHKEGVDRWSRKVLSGKNPEGDAALAARTLAEVGGAEDQQLFAQQLGATDRKVRLWAAAGLLRQTEAPESQQKK